jgi:peptidoglycan glycosyltransferase
VSRQIRRVATLMLVLFGVMFVNLNVIQLVRSDELANNPNNRRLIIREYQIRRGPIVVGDRDIVRSEPTDDDLKYRRVYEDPKLWSHLTGYYSFVLQRAGLEAAMNEALTGTSTEVLAQNLAELLGGRDDRGNAVQLTVDPAVQREARRALGDRVGAIVAIEPTTGAVIASYANPGYDPNVLSSHDASSILEHWQRLQRAPDRPLLDRVTRATYPPGSTFKIITAAAALERGQLEPQTALADLPSYTPPQTSRAITNFSPGTCSGTSTITLADALRVSCNTAFAKLGVDLGADALIGTAERFGFNRTPPYVLPTVKSQIPKDLDPPATAQSAIGQRDVRTTPLQAAMVVAAIANEGRLMRPYVVAQVLDPTGRPVRGPDTGVWSDGRFDGQAVSPRTAQLLREMMYGVVDEGTGRAARIPGVRVGGKTGTAQVPGETSTVWFLGFADDRVAVAVVLPDAGTDATGGGDAAPIAKAIMEAALGLR